MLKHTQTHTHVQTDTQTHTQHILSKVHLISECFSFEFAVKAFCVTVRAAGFPDGCV